MTEHSKAHSRPRNEPLYRPRLIKQPTHSGAMMSSELFIKGLEHEGLESFAARMAKVLNVGQLERRYSSNYPPDEEYFIGTALGISVTFARSPDSDVDGFEFWICLAPDTWVEDHSFLDHLADLIARRLTIAGEKVVWLPEAARNAERRVYYHLDPTPESRDRVVTTDT